MTPDKYDADFFDLHVKDALKSAEVTIPIVLTFCHPVSVIDIGCGLGAWLSAWKKNGIKKVLGVDGEYVDKKKLLVDDKEFHAFDLEKGYQDTDRFDLVTSLEVAEHLNPEFAERFIASLCSLGNLVLFSAAIPGQGGTLHVNEQYPDFWIDHFKKNGFVPVDCLRMKIWNKAEISWWYRQNILFFVKETELSSYPSLAEEYKKTLHPIPSLVHPDSFRFQTVRADYYESVLKSPLAALRFFFRTGFRGTSKKSGK